MSSATPIRPKNFREKVFFRQLRSQVEGSARVEYGLTQIMGVGMRFAQAVVIIAKLDPSIRIGAIPEKDLNRIEEIIMDPITHGIPEWMVNRKKDIVTGKNLHIVGNKLQLSVKKDIDRMKRIRSYKGVRHHMRLKVRGQRTKSTGRHGLVVGVMRRTRKELRNE